MLYLVLLYNGFAYFAEQSLVSPKRWQCQQYNDTKV